MLVRIAVVVLLAAAIGGAAVASWRRMNRDRFRLFAALVTAAASIAGALLATMASSAFGAAQAAQSEALDIHARAARLGAVVDSSLSLAALRSLELSRREGRAASLAAFTVDGTVPAVLAEQAAEERAVARWLRRGFVGVFRPALDSGVLDRERIVAEYASLDPDYLALPRAEAEATARSASEHRRGIRTTIAGLLVAAAIGMATLAGVVVAHRRRWPMRACLAAAIAALCWVSFGGVW